MVARLKGLSPELIGTILIAILSMALSVYAAYNANDKAIAVSQARSQTLQDDQEKRLDRFEERFDRFEMKFDRFYEIMTGMKPPKPPAAPANEP